MKEKRCYKCGKTKPILEFHKDKQRACGYKPACKECRHIEKMNRLSESEYEKHLIYQKNKGEREYLLKQNKRRCSNCRNIKDLSEFYKRRESVAYICKECTILLGRKYERDRRQNDAKYRLNKNVKRAFNRVLNGNKNGVSWKIMISYTQKELRNHLESLFVDGMCWNNYGKWHLDHIKPVSSFKFTSYEDDEFKECWSLDNLQPLWAEDNLKKGSRINYKRRDWE